MDLSGAIATRVHTSNGSQMVGFRRKGRASRFFQTHRHPLFMSVQTVALVLALTLTAGCRADSTPSRQAGAEHGVRADAPSESDAKPWFDVKGEDVGLVFTHINGMSGQYYFPEMLPPGVGLFDYDNDGDLDIYLVQGAMLGEGKMLKDARFPAAPGSPLNGRLFRNDLVVNPDGTRTLRVTDVTEQSGIDARGYGMGVATGDYNNDGCVDLYLTFVGQNRLYRNNCDGTFTNVSQTSRTDGTGWGSSAAFLDYDRDGWLDLYVGNYVQYDITKDQTCIGLTGRRDYCTPAVYTAQPDRLYHNERNGTFVDVTSKALLGGSFGPALGVSTADFNNDGWIDIYVANDTKPNLLWMNQRNGTFRDTALIAGVALTGEGKAEASMGVDAGDMDNDGDEDVFVTALPAEGSNLFVNDGHGQFDDRSARSGLGALTLGYSGFGTAWLDFDNDGWLDLIQVNGAIQALEGQQTPFPYAEHKLLFRNRGDGRFSDVTQQAGAAFSALEVSRGIAVGDIDNDGYVDAVVNNLNGHPALLLNKSGQIGNRHHWACLRLIGERVDRDMLGARVEVRRAKGPTLFRRVRADGSYASANDPRVFFGLGESTEIPSIQVRWPDGRSEQWPELPIDRCTTWREGSGRREP
jgi:hypothetical protein